MSVRVKFWGARGTFPCPGENFQRFGGDTSCVEVIAGEERIIWDAGTGLRALGDHLHSVGVLRTQLLLSHAHIDHLVGFPFFLPSYFEGNRMDVRAAHLKPFGGLKEVLTQCMKEPTFPVLLASLKADLHFHDFDIGETLILGPDLTANTAMLNHPNGATGYRLNHAGKAVCYVTDTEHEPGKPDENILALIDDADLLIYDCTYTDKEFAAHRGWGHSTWEEGIRLCQQARVKRLAIFHHDPGHDDAFMDQIECDARRAWDGAFIARDGLSIDIE